MRGYGLVDSPKTTSAPGRRLALKAVPAPNAKAAAHYYPAGYWFSLLKVPGKDEFPGTGGRGQRDPARHRDRRRSGSAS